MLSVSKSARSAGVDGRDFADEGTVETSLDILSLKLLSAMGAMIIYEAAHGDEWGRFLRLNEKFWITICCLDVALWLRTLFTCFELLLGSFSRAIGCFGVVVQLLILLACFELLICGFLRTIRASDEPDVFGQQKGLLFIVGSILHGGILEEAAHAINGGETRIVFLCGSLSGGVGSMALPGWKVFLVGHSGREQIVLEVVCRSNTDWIAACDACGRALTTGADASACLCVEKWLSSATRAECHNCLPVDEGSFNCEQPITVCAAYRPPQALRIRIPPIIMSAPANKRQKTSSGSPAGPSHSNRNTRTPPTSRPANTNSQETSRWK
ncbi:hypothetical protein KCU74_g90, partial [Aureobasidium melanogenum]